MVGDLDVVVDEGIGEILSDATLTDAFGDRIAFGFEVSFGEPVIESGAHGVGEDDLDGGVVLFEGLTDAGECSACSCSAGEGVDMSVSLGEDFFSCGLVVSVFVGEVIELISPDSAVRVLLIELRGEALRDVDVIFWIRVWDGWDEF